MKNKRNYYRILHVQPDAPVELIRMSYRTIMQKLKKHPDLGGDEWDASVINEAYAVLCDDKLRAAYDERLLRERTMADAGAQSSTQRAGANQDPPHNSQDDAAQSDSHNQNTQSHGEQTKHQGNSDDSAHEYKNQNEQASSANDEHAGDGDRCFFCALAYEGSATEDRDCAACASPLLAMDPVVQESNSKRAILRQPNFCPIQLYAFWPGEPQAAVLADLSPNGLKFRFHHELQIGHVLKIHCPLFSAVAKTTHSVEADTSFLIGARFLSVRFATQQGTFVSTSV